jgi:Glyoxalase-like domain
VADFGLFFSPDKGPMSLKTWSVVHKLSTSRSPVRVVALLVIVLMAPMVEAALGPSGIHLDHVPIAVRDLPAAVAQFRSLGFTIKPGRPHQNGIENASIKFADGSYVELITAHDGSDPLARRYEEFLKTGEGASYVFLRDSQGAFADRVRRAGGRREESGPFVFTELPASWRTLHLQLIEYLAPAQDSPETYQHANGARRVVAVWMFIEPGDDSIARELGADLAGMHEFAFDDRASRSIEFADHTRLMLTPRRSQDVPRVFSPAVMIEVESLTRLKQIYRLERALARGSALWLPPSEMHGVWLGLVERSSWARAVR